MTPSTLASYHSKTSACATAWSQYLRSLSPSKSDIGDIGSDTWFSSEASKANPSLQSLIIKHGLPAASRPALWRAFSASSPSTPYATLLPTIDKCVADEDYNELELTDKSIPRTIDVDLLRTLPDHPMFLPVTATSASSSTSSPNPNLASLKRILLAVAVNKPAIGYLQGMNYIAAFLFLTFQPTTPDPADLEAAVYTVLSHVTSTALPGYFTANLPSLLSDTTVLTKLLAATDPALSSHLTSLGLDLTLLTPQWSLTCFVTGLPWPTVSHIFDLLLFTTASHRSGAAGVFLHAQLGVLTACKPALMTTNSMCRAITTIRATCATLNVAEIGRGAGLSLHSFTDVAKLRKEVARMNRTDMVSGEVAPEPVLAGKREREESTDEAEAREASERTSFTMFATPMTKKRRTALEKFAVKNGIERDDPEGKFLFGQKKGGGLVDAAEGFFKFAQDLMTPTPAARAGGGGRKEELISGQVLFAEKGGGGGQKGVSFASSCDKENSRTPFLSPNSKGFEMTPVKSARSGLGGKSTPRRGATPKQRVATPYRAAHFFTSPEPVAASIMSPVSKMR